MSIQLPEMAGIFIILLYALFWAMVIKLVLSIISIAKHLRSIDKTLQEMNQKLDASDLRSDMVSNDQNHRELFE